MGKRNIHIENLNLRLPRSSAGSAREIGNWLGGEVLRNVAENTRDLRGSRTIKEISAGRIKMDGAGGVGDLKKQIADRVWVEIKKSFER